MDFNLLINRSYQSGEFVDCWKTKSSGIEFGENARLLFSPFRCFALSNFVDVDMKAYPIDRYVQELRQEIRTYEFFDKNNDLYKFKQTDDLSKITKIGPATTKFVDFLNENVKKWLENLTGIELTSNVAITASNYEYTDVLLCHDDELENRRIAFVFYLTDDDWSDEFGGQLDLFSTDESNKPVKIETSITPLPNVFTFFEVLPNSYHQVREVVNRKRSRLSINGWYHGTPIVRPPLISEVDPILMSPGHADYDDVITWINPDYLKTDVQERIRGSFEDESQIELRNFLQNEKYLLVAEELKSSSVSWRRRTPYDKRSFFVPEQIPDADTPNLGKLVEIMTSEAMFLLLSQLTGVNLHSLFEKFEENDEEKIVKRARSESPQSSSCRKKFKNSDASSGENLEEQNSPRCSKKIENEEEEQISKCQYLLRKFCRGCYTLLHDSEKLKPSSISSDFALDAQLFFTDHDWKLKTGGYTCYLTKGEDEELLSLKPKRNSLALVYRGDDTMRFVKYVNARCENDAEFVDLAMVFYEK